MSVIKKYKCDLKGCNKTAHHIELDDEIGVKDLEDECLRMAYSLDLCKDCYTYLYSNGVLLLYNNGEYFLPAQPIEAAK